VIKTVDGQAWDILLNLPLSTLSSVILIFNYTSGLKIVLSKEWLEIKHVVKLSLFKFQVILIKYSKSVDKI
jgi:hypothetical protein